VSPSTSPNSPPHNFAEYIIVDCKIIKGIYKKKKVLITELRRKFPFSSGNRVMKYPTSSRINDYNSTQGLPYDGEYFHHQIPLK
jgi:hypothetical protein